MASSEGKSMHLEDSGSARRSLTAVMRIWDA